METCTKKIFFKGGIRECGYQVLPNGKLCKSCQDLQNIKNHYENKRKITANFAK